VTTSGISDLLADRFLEDLLTLLLLTDLLTDRFLEADLDLLFDFLRRDLPILPDLNTQRPDWGLHILLSGHGLPFLIRS
jgi:hypothetical protein